MPAPETTRPPETARTSVPASAVPGRASGDEGSEWPSLSDYLPLSSTLFDPTEGPSRGAEMPATAPERRGFPRYSTPFFLHFAPDYEIRTLPGCAMRNSIGIGFLHNLNETLSN
jgi:hypothetical protein